MMWLCLAQAALQDPKLPDRVEVRVVASSGGSLYLDKGSADRLEAGDRVIFYPLGGGAVEATLHSVSRSGSRCQPAADAPAVDLGTRGEVFVPKERGRPRDPAPSVPPRAPEHPPWAHPPLAWDEKMPLLGTASRSAPDERPIAARGRAYTQYLTTQNRQGGVENTYALARAGAYVEMDNLLGDGGLFRAQGEVYRRDSDLAAGEDVTVERGRLDRLSYIWGDHEGEPWRLELGRFFQNAFPELGLLDGAEGRLRTTHHRVGLSAGELPDRLHGLRWSDDLQASASYEFSVNAREDLVAGVAYQATWHEGDRDRDLLLGKVYGTPLESVTVYAAVWLDYYGAHDDFKSPGFEVTEAHAQAVWRFAPGQGLGVHALRVRTPQILRDEFDLLIAPIILENHVQRFGLTSWHALGTHLHADTRLDRWKDQNGDEGVTGELRLALRNLALDPGEIAAAVYRVDGVFTEGSGVRFSATRHFDALSVSVTYDVGRYTFAEDPEERLEQSVHATVDVALGAAWTLSAFANAGFGDEQDYTSVGLYLQKRF
jgi:hypothetical protein